jgi:2-polyprenyl-3-methyl-5-hydroxy-6-metoxy-1,4-benzoquinol methylase
MLKCVMQSLHAPIYRARIKALIDAIVPHLRESDRVLDVGCGSGALAQAILTSPSCPAKVAIEGLERVKRGNEPICVHEYQGGPIPFASQSYDVVILADVLHQSRTQ